MSDTSSNSSHPVLGAVLLITLAILVALATKGCGPEPTTDDGQTNPAPTVQERIPRATATLGPAPSPTPTHTPKWTTIQTFKGNGNKKTVPFTVPNRWQLLWSCNPASDGGSYNLFVDVVRPDGTYLDAGAVLTTCQAGNTRDSTQEYQGGTAYLDVQSEGAWTIQIQVLE